MSSVQGRVATPLEGPYSATKHALEALSESLHYELGHFGIRVVIVEPGYIAPGMKPADDVAGDDAYRELWEQWDGHRRQGDRARRPTRARSWWPWPSASAIEDPTTPLRVPVGDDAVTDPGGPGPARRRRLRIGHAPDARHDLVRRRRRST